jgi:hypothetical protein
MHAIWMGEPALEESTTKCMEAPNILRGKYVVISACSEEDCDAASGA